MSKSWEYYQQTENGNQLILYWICGLSGTVNRYFRYPKFILDDTGIDFTNPITGEISEVSPGGLSSTDCLYAVPFDQLKAVTVSTIWIRATRLSDAATPLIHVGIYANTSDTENFPRQRVWRTAAAVTLLPGMQQIPINPPVALRTDTRYWAVFLGNAACDGTRARLEIDGLGNVNTPVLFWGAKFGPQSIFPITGLRKPFTFAALPNPWP